MPWHPTSSAEERIRSVKSYRAGLYTMSELCPHPMPDRVAEKILLARERQPTWGPKKLIAWLARMGPGGTPALPDPKAQR